MHLDEYREWLATYDGGELVLDGPLHIRTIYIGKLFEAINIRTEDPQQIQSFLNMYPQAEVLVQHVITTTPTHLTP